MIVFHFSAAAIGFLMDEEAVPVSMFPIRRRTVNDRDFQYEIILFRG
jgi:hypothetical protein